MVKKIIIIVSFPFTWSLRRWLLQKLFGYKIHPTASIGYAWIFPKQLIMGAHSSIGHMTICKGLDLLQMGEHSSIGRGNWITAFPSGSSDHFVHQKDREPELIIGDHSAITNRHLIDCTNSVTIGNFTTFAGFKSQILTHSIDLERCRQSSLPVKIGDYCFVGTDSVILGGSSLPDYSMLGAKSLLNKHFLEDYTLYAGVPAKPIKKLPGEYKYFSRTVGFVY